MEAHDAWKLEMMALPVASKLFLLWIVPGYDHAIPSRQ
jgi:hypothetical protein